MMRRTLVAAIIVALARPAGATTLLPADLGELSRDAIAIAVGRFRVTRSGGSPVSPALAAGLFFSF